MTIQLQVDGILRDFIEVKTFRAAHHLPEDFGVALFEPKDYTGLGSIEHGGAALATLRKNLLELMPRYSHIQAWLDFLPALQQTFRDQLEAVNAPIGLRAVEIDFAAAGFGDMCRDWVYALIHAQAARQPTPAFRHIYHHWLYETVRVSMTVHEYVGWQIQVITHAYGRIGLLATHDQQTYYVYDARLACPAEGFMLSLLAEVTALMAESVK